MKGFTFIEALVSAVIFSLIFGVIFSTMNQGLVSWRIADVNIEVQQDLRRALMAMERQLRQTRSSQVSIAANDIYYATITFKVPQDTDGDGDAIDASGNIEWSGNITYSLNADSQLVRTDALGNMALANNITNLQFRRLSGNPAVIQMALTAQKTTVSGRTASASADLQVRMRN